jgi:proteasome lid subunit RPN8/RPN11
VTITRRALDVVLAHARAERPRECCGMLLGHSQHILTAVRARNLADDPLRRFLIDPEDHIAARREARRQGLDVVGFYHSHPRSGAAPSAADDAEASYADAVSLIVGMDGEVVVETRLFRLRESRLEEERLEVESG